MTKKILIVPPIVPRLEGSELNLQQNYIRILDISYAMEPEHPSLLARGLVSRSLAEETTLAKALPALSLEEHTAETVTQKLEQAH